MVRATLAEAFERLGLSDPDGHLLTATARYPLDAIVDGIATFEGKQRAGTLPPGVDARYLLGIVRNLADDHEARQIATALWDARTRARDRLALHLQAVADELATSSDGPGPSADACSTRALATPSNIERLAALRFLAARVLPVR